MDPLISALLRPEAYDHPVAGIELLQTHISWILLTGRYAYKIKKPVNLGFVDFSSLERRRHFCQEELRLNQRLSPELYLGVRSIHGPPERACLHGEGPEVDVAVMMHQFRQSDLLAAVLRQPMPLEKRLDLVEDLADRLAHFHAAAAIAPADSDFGSAARVQEPALANLAVLERILGDDPRLPPLRRWVLAEGKRLTPWFEGRRQQQRVREGHGDLHLGNLVLHHGRITAFDCLEFNAGLRWIDVISDLAFLAMDLQRHQQPLLAAALLDRWLSHSGDYGGLVSWRWYLAYRALVRAKVSALQLSQAGQSSQDETTTANSRPAGRSDLDAYLQLAADVTLRAVPVLLITHGVSGSGKSHLARQLARRMGWLHLRSDVERQRLFGRWGEPCAPPLQGDPYDPAVSDRLYGDRLSACCSDALAAGFSLICDATFLKRRQRQAFRQLAERHGARFAILHCRCEPERARQRILDRLRRGGDPSEATPEVLQEQLRRIEPLDERELTMALDVDLESAALREPARNNPSRSPQQAGGTPLCGPSQQLEDREASWDVQEAEAEPALGAEFEQLLARLRHWSTIP